MNTKENDNLELEEGTFYNKVLKLCKGENCFMVKHTLGLVIDKIDHISTVN